MFNRIWNYFHNRNRIGIEQPIHTYGPITARQPPYTPYFSTTDTLTGFRESYERAERNEALRRQYNEHIRREEERNNDPRVRFLNTLRDMPINNNVDTTRAQNLIHHSISSLSRSNHNHTNTA